MQHRLSLEIPQTLTKTVSVKNCCKCKKEFETGNLRKMYCSVRCKNSTHSLKTYHKSMGGEKTKEGICSYSHCKKSFSKTRRSNRYCSKYCSRAAIRQKIRGQKSFIGEVINCKGCGETVIKDHARRKYCSDICRNKHLYALYYQNNKEKFSESGKIWHLTSTNRRFKKDICELCGFKPVNMCQLDIDHIDGNHSNDDLSNLQTLCANCHRLKTFLNKDGIYGKAYNVIEMKKNAS